MRKETSYTNNHIILKNKNTMTYDPTNFLQNKKTEVENYRSDIERRLMNSYPSILKQPRPYNFEILFDDFYKGLLVYIQEYRQVQIDLINENYPDIMNYLTNEEKYVKAICNNNDNMIMNELNELITILKKILLNIYQVIIMKFPKD